MRGEEEEEEQEEEEKLKRHAALYIRPKLVPRLSQPPSDWLHDDVPRQVLTAPIEPGFRRQAAGKQDSNDSNAKVAKDALQAESRCCSLNDIGWVN